MLEHIVIAVDESEVSRNAIRTALSWAAEAKARATIFTVSELRPAPALAAVGMARDGEWGRSPALEGIQRWLAAEVDREPTWSTPDYAVAIGVPSIEIARFADNVSADLLVLGRKQRSTAARLLVGDTADAVARRSRVPCLFVPRPLGVPTTLLVALDGTARGLTVLAAARKIADAVGAGLDLLTVEPAPADERDAIASSVPSGRTTNLRRMLNSEAKALRVRRGDPVTEVLREVSAVQASVLVVGYHRGGPPGVLELGSVARHLTHSAPCAVLTIPL